MPAQPLIEWATHFINRIDLSSHSTLLDVDCRNGQLTALLAKNYHQQQFIAIDNVPAEIEQAKNIRLSNVRFKHMDARHFKLEHQVDGVISFGALF